jgi:broad specificity phosphatase PhoE
MKMNKTGKRKAIFMRHADRPKFASETEDGSLGEHEETDVSITEEGRARARESALQLGLAKPRVFSSPLKRCVQTAQAAIDAMVWDVDVEPQSFLHYEHFALDLEDCNESEMQQLIRDVLSGKEVIEDLDQKVWQVLQQVVEAAEAQDVLLVTHDWWMSLFLSRLTDAFEVNGFDIWPEFCESYTLDISQMIITYRGEKYQIVQPGI